MNVVSALFGTSYAWFDYRAAAKAAATTTTTTTAVTWCGSCFRLTFALAIGGNAVGSARVLFATWKRKPVEKGYVHDCGHLTGRKKKEKGRCGYWWKSRTNIGWFHRKCKFRKCIFIEQTLSRIGMYSNIFSRLKPWFRRDQKGVQTIFLTWILTFFRLIRKLFFDRGIEYNDGTFDKCKPMVSWECYVRWLC